MIPTKPLPRFFILLGLAAASGARADAVDDYIRGRMAEDHLPGVALAIVRDGKIVKAAGYGVANLETGTPVAPDTVFRIASMSKQFCAAAVLLLEKENKLRLDDSVRTYLPDAPASWQPVTLRHLLTHTSGIANVTEQPDFHFDREYDEKRLLTFLAAKPLVSAPGEKFHYSNSNYAILGWVVHRVSGEPLAKFVQERIFAPLGMAASGYPRWPDLVPHRANGYRWDRDHYRNAWPNRPTGMDGSGAIMTDVLDLAKWDAALNADLPLGGDLKRQMWTSMTLNDGKKTGYGFGWYVKPGEEHHTGETSGFTSAILRDTRDRLTVVLLRNAQAPGALPMAREVLRRYLAASGARNLDRSGNAL